MISGQSFGSNTHPYISQWGGFGTSESGKFNLPQQIAVDDKRNIYVADTGNAKIQKFDNNGNFLLSWETNSFENGKSSSPVGIVIYENNVYVVDEMQNIIQKFDNNGNFVSKWGEFGAEDGQFNEPQGITLFS